jgi:ubiquinol-cytochrome c reductase cytochrome c subunit
MPGGVVAAGLVVVGLVTAIGTASYLAIPGPAAANAAGGPVGGSGAADVAAADDQVRALGASLFQQQCASCHGVQGQGTDNGPSLLGAGAAGADFYLRTGRMPLGAPGQPAIRHDPVFSDDQIAALVAYVASLGNGPAIPQVQEGGDLQRGWELYQANCAACHAATGIGNAIGGGYAAADLSHATPTQIAEAMRIGPGAMPVFDFGQADQDAIVRYVTSLRSEPNPGGFPIGGFGPVSEGFVAIVIGLTAFVMVARFVGRRTHEGQPETPDDEAVAPIGPGVPD